MRLAMEAAEIGSWHWDLRADAQTWSPLCKRLLGVAPDAPMSFSRFLDCLHPEDRAAVAEAIQQSDRDRAPLVLEYRVVWPDGSIHWVWDKGTSIYALDGTPLRRDGVVVDITDRRAQDMELQESKARFQAQYQGIPIPTFTWQWRDPDFVLIDYNAAAKVITQAKIEAMIGISAHELYRETPEIITDMTRCFQGQTTLEREMTYRLRSTGETKEFIVNYVYVPNDLVMVHTQDITERRRLEEQYRQAQKMESIGRLAGGIAHDFNNLLSIILGYSELTEAQLPEGSPLRANVHIMADAAHRASKLTGQLLSFARRQPSDPKIISPNEAVESISQMLRPLIGEDISLRTDLETAVGKVRMDPHQLEQALVNLVVNARDAMPAGGLLTVRTTEEVVAERRPLSQFALPAGHYVRISVADTGTGMTEEVKARLFEPFFTTKEQGHGTGLGLASVYGIVKQNDGYILADSVLGQGTTFSIYLPKVSAPEASTSGPSAALPANAGRETILVVEDEPILRELATLALQKQGYTVLEAENGVEALQIAAQYSGDIHLLLTDAIMPQMGGKELSERLRQVRPKTRILVASGYSEDRFTAPNPFPADAAFLPKPFMPRGLVAKVREVLT